MDHGSKRGRDAVKQYAGRIIQKMENKDWPARAFITEKILRDFWTDVELKRAAIAMELPFGDDGIIAVKKHLIRTFSILVTILWDEWEKFPDLFLRGKAGTTDEEVMKLSRRELERSLGPVWASLFRSNIAVFNPIFITEGQAITSDEKNMNRGDNAEHKKYVDEALGIRLPFLLDKSGPELGKGGGGRVTQETIAAGQFINKDKHTYDAAKVVARKCFRTKASYDREEGVLKLLSGCRRQHTHILGPLAMISLQGDFSILMEVADCNLGKLLSKDGKMSDNISLASLLGQVEGLADALSFLHDSKMGTGATIYHKDVKADNVLIMRPTGSDDIGHWMLSDFDVSNYYQTDPGRGPPGSAYGWTKVFTFQGRQDEHLAPDNGYGYGPYSDVWSLGCILTRVVCRKSLGTKGLEAFERSLSMGDPENNGYFYRGNAINPNVEDMLNDFCTSSCEMTKACGVLLKSVLCMDRHKRPTAKAFQEKLYQIREQKTHLIVGPADWLQIPLSQPEIFSDTTEWFLPSLSSFQSPQNEPLPLEGSPKPHQPHVPPQIRFPDQSSPSDTESDYQGSSQRQSSEATLELQAPEVPLDKVESPRNDATNSVRIAIEQTVEDTAMSLLKDLFSGTITTYSDLSQYSAGLTALCHAAQKGYTRVVEFLIDKGAHVDEPDGRKTTPLMYACREGHSSTAESLIDKGANWNLKGEDEYTCLHFATETRKIEILELFQRKRPGAPRPLDANQLNKFDRTPLELHFHRKAEHDRYELIRPLLALGAEPKVSSQDPKHQTAVDLVIHEDDRKAMNILLMEDPTLKVSKSGMKQSGIKLSRDMNKLLTKYDRLEP